MPGSIALDVQETGVAGNLGGSEADYQMLFLAALATSWRKFLAFYRLGGVSRALGRSLEYLYESAFGYWWAIRHRSAAGEPTASDLPATVEIDPADLRYQSRFGKAHFPTKDSDTERSPIHDELIVGVVGGRWDRFRTEWTETRIHRSLEARFLEGESWERTVKYRYAACKVENGLEDWRSSTIDELERRCADLDTLYDSMAEEGYVSQTELLEHGDDGMETGNAATKSILETEFPHEMRVGIGRNGEIIRFSAGKHRLSIAKLLGLETVPVIVVVRHERWATIRERFAAADSLEALPAEYREFANHPDLRVVAGDIRPRVSE
ncbi:hypothetical protein C491_21311 [Natronococcus amylolyticus DSM 10524]|uniref:ParB/Sulfiredoxin domain-containing protein n=1 Tax=Natronococcus amylolyticus DSM 10524 TaxID=1227497 RepID=L9WVF6_9EURY|nr:hypothetical protein [Natronococcus amylolyticus]ELY53469.1 hypothetical protein C491_21311 [Natronococcus amylolyticus DSM 10524]